MGSKISFPIEVKMKAVEMRLAEMEPEKSFESQSIGGIVAQTKVPALESEHEFLEEVISDIINDKIISGYLVR